MRRVCLLFCALFACVDSGPGPTQRQIDPGYVRKNLLAEVPADMDRGINADFGGKVVYLGNDATAETLSPGAKVTITHYWKVIEPPGETWRVFAHLIGRRPEDWLNLDETDMRIGHGPATWRAGDIIRDEQEFWLPDSWSSPDARLVVGLFPRGGHTVKDRMPVVSGPADSESQVLAVRFPVTGAGKPAPAKEAAPGYVIRRAPGPVTVDGRADEPAWGAAPKSPAFVAAEGSPAMSGDTTARLLWDDQYLYVFVECKDPDVFSSYQNHDDPLWKEDVVELFIDADRNRRGYVELQVNPQNARFDAWFATTRAAKSDVAWNADMISAVVVHGTADNRDDQDTGWDVEIAVPLAAVKGGDPAMRVQVPPVPGDRWRLNVVRIDMPGDGHLAAASWNQITYQDFHALARMLEVQFGDSEGNTAPPASETPEEQPGAATPGEANPAAAKPDETTPAAAKPDEAKPGEAKPGEVKSGEAKPAAAKPAAADPAAAKPAATPGAPKPAAATPSE